MDPDDNAADTRFHARVVVADDDPAIARLMATRLRALGHEAIVVHDGAEAILAVEREAPDLLLCDIAMPIKDGNEVLADLRAKGVDVAIIMATAFGSEYVAVKAMRLGADDYLGKPFDGAEFDAVVSRTLESHRLRRENARLQSELNAKRVQLEREFARAAEVQQLLFPSAPPVIPGWQISGKCTPALEVGGDFYDWQAHGDGSLSFTIADVMGKGLAASLFMATVRAGLRALGDTLPVAETVAALESALQPDFDRSGVFVTMVHGRIDLDSGTVDLVDVGHGLASVIRSDGRLHRLPLQTSLPMGIDAPHRRPVAHLSLHPGEILVLQSDGLEIPEHANLPSHPADLATTDSIADALFRAASPLDQSDDQTLLVVRRT